MLPTVAVGEQFFLVVEELLAGLRGELEVRPLDDGVHRAGLLAEAAIDTLRHVDVVARRASATVLARLGLDGDGLGRADGLAKLAGDAALLAVRIAAQHVLAAKARAQGPFFVRIVQRHLGLEEVAQRQRHAREQLLQQ
jgi:hypothetical protein